MPNSQAQGTGTSDNSDGRSDPEETEGKELSVSTQRAYRAGWRDFVGWCRDRGAPALPASAEVVAEFLEGRKDLALSTIRNRLSAISHYHEVSGVEDPTDEVEVSDVWHRISQEKRSEEGPRSGAEASDLLFPPSEMIREGPALLPDYYSRRGDKHENLQGKLAGTRSAFLDEFIEREGAPPERLTAGQRRLIPEVKYDLLALRDRALLLLMAAGGVRRAEVVRLDVTDVVPVEEDLLVGIRRKNGTPKRALIAEPAEELRYCTARAVAAWILAAGLTEGPLFRSFDAHENMKPTRIALSSVNHLLRQRAEKAGLEPEDWTPSDLKKEPE